ncbi:FAD-binding protein [Mycolicibacterium fluoranthenivorans]|uniref:Tricarballylate dehydrogenase n=1 Tax=Mycolicibacterium fluoranthenivorans TaxID=258505 RepID=A0A7X5TY42_9MYCO|nr:FAD-binding protein [Mycolicibacterium fluoranthenivorans]MCV7355891.1 FAD-binding protein [Mycolicibacterium fluoranthenivorans]NIH94890.1 tricarballylate dehydrogenase [Mycolicibacterium fluoranthenivorans]
MTTASKGATTSADVVVIGSGIAGMSAAVSAAQTAVEDGGGRVILIDRATKAEAGGLTKWTSAYLRIDDVYEPGESFVPDIVEFSDGRTPQWYVEELAERLPETMEWIQTLGIRFKRLPTYFINSSRKRLQPVGGGEALLKALQPEAERLGVETRYNTTAHRLVLGQDGAVTGVEVAGPDGPETVYAGAVIIASGGFEGDPDFLARELGSEEPLIPIAPGVHFNRGEGITMALDVGAARAGEWNNFHAEPVDPRCESPEPLVMVFPYGILVDQNGNRFIDEGRGTVDETYESTARAIWGLPGGIAYYITDRQLDRVEARERGILTTVKPVTAPSIEELAEALGLPIDQLRQTVEGFNEAVVAGPFDWRQPDGKSTVGLEPPKSNWALPIEDGPYLAYPIKCAIVFTFGGLDTDRNGQVLTDAGEPIGGLYAAGECTGLYHGKYPGGTSVLRGMIFGRISGAVAMKATRSRTPATTAH